MANNKDAHRLAVIFHVDVVGSTKLVQQDERLAHTRITDAFQRFSQTIQEYNGEVHEIRGDALLAEFARASDAVCAALAFQRQNTAHNKTFDDDIIPDVRIGIALGEVVIADNTITGAGVVLAQRIEQLCEPGGVYITEAIREALPSRLPLDNENLGKHDLKGFEKSVRVYAVRLEPDADVPPPEPQQARKRRQTPLVAAAVAVLVVIAIALVWFKPWQAREQPASIERMALPLPDKPSIAVLPFDNLSGDAEKEYMVDGMSEHIISTLARIPDMFVVARNSTFFYKGKAVDVRQVAEDLGVQYVLEGSLQTAGERVRITAQLIDALSGLHVWSEQYDRSLDDFFALQDDITHKIAVSLLAELVGGERAIIAAQTTTNLKAWLLLQQAGKAYRTFTRDGIAQARKISREALELDSNYAQAWTLIGWTHFIDARFGYSESRSESVKRANEMADKAASIYPESAELYYLRAFIHMIEGELDEAVALGQKLLEAAPGNGSYYAGHSMIMLYAGGFDDSIESMKKAIRLSPRYPTWYDLILGRAYSMKRDYESAVSTFSRITTENTSSTIAAGGHTGLAFVYAETGRDDEAHAEIEKALKRVKWLSIESYRRFGYFKDPAHAQRFEAGLRKAGLPENPPLALPDKPSIAVLPFTNLTGDSEQDYFVDGFTNAIITNLSKFPEFFVIASNSVFTYKGKAVRINEVGRELGVRYVLEGSLQRGSNNISVHAQLIEAASEKHLWAEQYEGTPEEIFSLQRDLTQQITSTLASRVQNLAHAAVSKKDETSLPAYELYLKAVIFEFGKEAFEKQIRLLERAIEFDPDFAAAYAELAERYLRLWQTRLADDSDEALRRARNAAHKAVTLDQQDYRSHFALGNLYLWADRDHDLAMAEFEKAMEINPNQADMMSMMSLFLAFMGRSEEAVDWTKRAMRLNPHYPAWYDWNAGFAYYMARDYDKALLGAKKTLALYPESLSVLRILAATYVEMGEMEKAREVAQKMLEIDPNFTLSGVRNVPFRRKVDHERYFGALAKAGLPQ